MKSHKTVAHSKIIIVFNTCDMYKHKNKPAREKKKQKSRYFFFLVIEWKGGWVKDQL